MLNETGLRKLIIAILFVLVVGCNEKQQHREAGLENRTVLKDTLQIFNSTVFLDEYIKEIVQSEKKFKGRYINLEGVVSDVDDQVIIFKGSAEGNLLLCVFENPASVKHVRRGGVILVQGLCKGVSGGNIVIDSCVLVR